MYCLSAGLACLVASTSLVQALVLKKYSNLDSVPVGEPAAIWFGDGQVKIELARRKNRQRGSGTLCRGCTCRREQDRVCVVHSLWHEFLDWLPDGTQPWQHISPAAARAFLRETLFSLQVNAYFLRSVWGLGECASPVTGSACSHVRHSRFQEGTCSGRHQRSSSVSGMLSRVRIWPSVAPHWLVFWKRGSGAVRRSCTTSKKRTWKECVSFLACLAVLGTRVGVQDLAIEVACQSEDEVWID